MYNPFSLENKTILVTGASSGIGRATAVECSKMGARLIITGRNEERLQKTFEQLEGDGHLQITADLNDKADLDNLIQFIPDLDGVVSNAGTGVIAPVKFIKEKDLYSVFSTNTFAPVLLMQMLIKAKKLNKNASIVFVTSISGVTFINPTNSVYGISKSATNSFAKFLAYELASKGIRCNNVNPGMIETPFIKDERWSEEDVAKDTAQYLLKRYGRPEEVAWAIIYLLSDASCWVTGSDLIIDGGKTISRI
jgi:NAD(P)-dependent dehydrogenase (short-subunit alcohol dehydrogenase family)